MTDTGRAQSAKASLLLASSKGLIKKGVQQLQVIINTSEQPTQVSLHPQETREKIDGILKTNKHHHIPHHQYFTSLHHTIPHHTTPAHPTPHSTNTFHHTTPPHYTTLHHYSTAHYSTIPHHTTSLHYTTPQSDQTTLHHITLPQGLHYTTLHQNAKKQLWYRQVTLPNIL